MSIEIVPTGAALGAEIRGVNLARAIDDETFAAIEARRPPQGDRGFESTSLQRRVSCEPDFLGSEAITATLQTDASPSEPDRRSASVRCSASAAFGKGSAVISIHTDTGLRPHPPTCSALMSHLGQGRLSSPG
jgi:hypothetical protein